MTHPTDKTETLIHVLDADANVTWRGTLGDLLEANADEHELADFDGLEATGTIWFEGGAAPMYGVRLADETDGPACEDCGDKGWDIFNGTQIQRCDACGILPDDSEAVFAALDWVREQAAIERKKLNRIE